MLALELLFVECTPYFVWPVLIGSCILNFMCGQGYDSLCACAGHAKEDTDAQYHFCDAMRKERRDRDFLIEKIDGVPLGCRRAVERR